jgi:hypothetical protein
MECKKRHVIAAFLLGVSASTLFGFVSGFSNLYGSYPSFASKAYRPSKPFSKDEFSISRYRQQLSSTEMTASRTSKQRIMILLQLKEKSREQLTIPMRW